MLDMIVSFCQLSTIQDYGRYIYFTQAQCFYQLIWLPVRPEFTNTLGIKTGRHPLREKIHKTRYVPNDVYASTESRFQIVTGQSRVIRNSGQMANVFKVATCLGRFVISLKLDLYELMSHEVYIYSINCIDASYRSDRLIVSPIKRLPILVVRLGLV